MALPKLHAGKHGQPLCGQSNVATYVVSAATWNRINPDRRCAKCLEVIKARKAN